MNGNEATRTWQRMLGVTADGDFGPTTLAASMALLPKPDRSQIGARPEPVTRLPWIAEGLTVFGLHEVRDNKALRAWMVGDGKTLGNPAVLPWCGDFAETCIKRALPDELFVGALNVNPYWARNWVNFGEACVPSLGCVVVFERGPSSAHVGFAMGQDATHLYVFGGNQGDSVSLVRVARSKLLASRWPLTWTGEPGPLPQMTPQNIRDASADFLS